MRDYQGLVGSPPSVAPRRFLPAERPCSHIIYHSGQNGAFNSFVIYLHNKGVFLSPGDLRFSLETVMVNDPVLLGEFWSVVSKWPWDTVSNDQMTMRYFRALHHWVIIIHHFVPNLFDFLQWNANVLNAKTILLIMSWSNFFPCNNNKWVGNYKSALL